MIQRLFWVFVFFITLAAGVGETHAQSFCIDDKAVITDSKLRESIADVLGKTFWSDVTLAELVAMDQLILEDPDKYAGIQSLNGVWHLCNLKKLRIPDNSITGVIPDQIAYLQKLEELRLSGNQLQGPLPSSFGLLQKVRRVNLANNEITGPIPPGIGALDKLEVLDLRSNQFDGPIPAGIGRLEHLRYLALNHNSFDGPIPPDLGDAQKLSHLDLRDNSLDGPIPSELGQLTRLKLLMLSENDLTGSIPVELSQLSDLETLILMHNQLSGTIPSALTQLDDLEELNVTHNNLEGVVPDFRLEELRICGGGGEGNQFSLITQETIDAVTGIPLATNCVSGDGDGSVVGSFLNAVGGIDWIASNILIERYVDGVGADFSCQGQSGMQLQISLDALKSGNPVEEANDEVAYTGGLSDCLVLAGNYQMTLEIIDISGNVTTSNFGIEITPAEVSANTSGVVVDCDQDVGEPDIQYPRANNTDTCRFTVDLKDRFLNIIDASQATFSFEDSGDNPPDGNYETQFHESLVIENIQYPDDETVTFEVRATAPSVHQYGDDLACLDNRTLDLVIDTPSINAHGEVQGGTIRTRKEVELRFDPMYVVGVEAPDLIVIPGEIALRIDYQSHIGTETVTPVHNIYTTTDESINDFDHEDTNKVTQGVENFGYAFFNESSVSTHSYNISTQQNPLHFVTKTSYTLGGDSISYPSGYLGPDPSRVSTLGVDASESCDALVGTMDPFPAMLVGAFVESDIASIDSSVYTFGDFGGLNFEVLNTFSTGLGAMELRDDLRRSLWPELNKDIEDCPNGFVEIEDTAELDALWGNDFTVVFEDCEVRIGKEQSLGLLPKIHLPEGQTTLVVRNGNLKINADLVYDGVQDSFGVALVNDDVKPYPEVGNIMIHPKVREFAGTYYADGGFFGYSGSDDLVNDFGSLNTSLIKHSPTKNNFNNRQLVLTGNLVSNNTLGGYMIKDNQLYNNPKYFSGWEPESDVDNAKYYDLHYVRRFDDFGDFDYCRRQSNGDCDENPMAFVIRNDRRAIDFPPPGFRNLQIYNLNQ